MTARPSRISVRSIRTPERRNGRMPWAALLARDPKHSHVTKPVPRFVTVTNPDQIDDLAVQVSRSQCHKFYDGAGCPLGIATRHRHLCPHPPRIDTECRDLLAVEIGS